MIKTRKKSIRDEIKFNESWLIDSENRNVELSELIIITDLNDLNNLILSIAICWYCEIFAIWLIEKQIRDVELSLLLKLLNLNFSIDLIDDLIELYFLAFVNDVSTRIFLLIWSISTTTRYFNFDESIEARILIFCWISKFDALIDLINDVNFVSNAIYEIFAFWLIEKQIRNVELKQLMKILNLIDLIDVKFD